MTDDKILKIKSHWEHAGKSAKDADGLKPTARDPYLQSVVEMAIERRLTPGAKLLDLGCGDGASTLRFAQVTGYAVGLDYVEDFIQRARGYVEKQGRKNIFFESGDVMNLSPVLEKFGLFDVVTSIRCLINLPDWHYQARAIRQISRAMRPGGIYLTSEGWQEGFEGLNRYRRRAQIPDIKVAEYNCLMPRSRFEAEVKKYFDIQAYINLGLYHFLSKLVQPLFTRPDPPSHLHYLNKIAADIVIAGINDSCFESCDYSGIYVLRRFDS